LSSYEMFGGSLPKLNRSIAIVQARMGSSRLPGKMMMDLSGHPILSWVLHRVKNSTSIDSIFLATSDQEMDKPLVELAQKLEVTVFRGSEEDVLGRYLATARMADAETIIRISADNPLIAPEELDRLSDFYSKAISDGYDSRYLYAFNFGPRMKNNYPDGFGAEIFSLELLEKLDALANKPLYREHVTTYIWDHPESFSILSVKAPEEIAFPTIKLDVDTKEDLEKLIALCDRLSLDSTAKEIVKVYRELFALR
jgi:spore coat polysaccharide biosynthesis protein SpsF